MSWKTPQEHIAAHLRPDGSVSENNLLCLIGMIETGEIAPADLEQLRARVAAMSPAWRVEFWDQLEDGYCRHCGGDAPCHCMNDE